SNWMLPVYVPTGLTPLKTFMSVDFPAPFSPQIPWISPRRTSSETPSRAFTGPKLIAISDIVRMLGGCIGISFIVVGDKPGAAGAVRRPHGLTGRAQRRR